MDISGNSLLPKSNALKSVTKYCNLSTAKNTLYRYAKDVFVCELLKSL